jgi:S-DNA-T family DNA segregation ATPase FtsK/SpoIIIE
MPGKGTIGIEVPNLHPEMVSMRSILATEKVPAQRQWTLPIALGKTISNEVYIGDLAKMPHLLVAGATGQGKSVGINSILVSLLYKKHPSQLEVCIGRP